MSPRTRRQTLRRTAGHGYQPYFTKNDATKAKEKSKQAATAKRAAPDPSATENVRTLVDPQRDLGMPSRLAYTKIEKGYISHLHPRKQEKALLTQVMFDKIWDVLHDPATSRVGTPQFRWWVRKMFVLSNERQALSLNKEDADGDDMPVVLHENRPIALKEQIYDILCYCHRLSNHGGRDKTTALIREHYSWIPKELISQFVKACPTCMYKKTGNVELALSLADKDNENKPVPTTAAPPTSRSAFELAIAFESRYSGSDLLNQEPVPAADNYWPATEPMHPFLHPTQSANSMQDVRDKDGSPCISRSSSAFVSSLLSELGSSKPLYALPPIRDPSSVEDVFGAVPAAQRPDITLPSIGQVMSGRSWGAHSQLHGTCFGYPDTEEDTYSNFYGDRFDPRTSQQAYGEQRSHLHHIDPALLDAQSGTSRSQAAAFSYLRTQASRVEDRTGAGLAAFNAPPALPSPPFDYASDPYGPAQSSSHGPFTRAGAYFVPPDRSHTRSHHWLHSRSVTGDSAEGQ